MLRIAPHPCAGGNNQVSNILIYLFLFLQLNFNSIFSVLCFYMYLEGPGYHPRYECYETNS